MRNTPTRKGRGIFMGIYIQTIGVFVCGRVWVWVFVCVWVRVLCICKGMSIYICVCTCSACGRSENMVTFVVIVFVFVLVLRVGRSGVKCVDVGALQDLSDSGSNP